MTIDTPRGFFRALCWAALIGLMGPGCDEPGSNTPPVIADTGQSPPTVLDTSVADPGDVVTSPDVDPVGEEDTQTESDLGSEEADASEPSPDGLAGDADGSTPDDGASPDAVVDASVDDVAEPSDATGTADTLTDASPADVSDTVSDDDDVDVATPDIPEDVPMDTGPPEPEYDCDALPQGPFGLVKLDGPLASEDLAFDNMGRVIGSNDQSIFKSPKEGPPQLFVPNMNFRAGMRMLPSGQLIVCDNTKGELVRIDADGVRHVFMTGLSYPNGLAVDLQGWVYVTEHDGGVIWRVHPVTGEATVITTLISSPNGIAFSPDYSTLYMGGFNGNKTVWAMSIAPDGTPGKLVAWATGVGTGWHDGMGVDACGNVYITDYGETTVYRISPDGQDVNLIIDGSDYPNAYLPNLQWGTGVGGWHRDAIYLPDGWNKGVFEVVIGVPGKEVPYP